MVYGREVGDEQLNFEASGALLDASLVMRDRETDSWWSIMTSDAIGGDLEGTTLEILPAGEKATWADWKRRHPDTLVLSVEGEEHVENNPYDNYFGSQGTFRDLEIDDDRLEPKAPIYSFWHDGVPWAVPHQAFRGGRLFDIEGSADRRLLLYRHKKSPIYESSRAYLVDANLADSMSLKKLLAQAANGAEGIQSVGGFDTFWYTWVAVNGDTRLLN